MKRYIAVIICLCLTAASVVFTLSADTKQIVAGASGGADSEVRDMEELYFVLDWLSNRNTGNSKAALYRTGSSDSCPQIFALSNTEDDSIIRNEHTSATLFEDASISKSGKYQIKTDWDSYQVVGDYALNLNRTLTLYLTENAHLYYSVGSFDSRSTYDWDSQNKRYYGSNERTTIYFDMWIYIGEEASLIKINRYSMVVQNEEETTTINIKEAYTGCWIQAEQAAVIGLLESADQTNVDALATLKEWLEEEFDTLRDNDESRFSKTEAIMQNDKKIGEEKILVDLTDSVNPYTEYVYSASDGYEKVVLSSVLTCHNIDNTMISADIEPDYVLGTEDDFEEIFNVYID